jgi:hypothetical protein
MNIDGVFTNDLVIESACIDRMQEEIDAVKLEMFPDTANATIDDWKRTRGVDASSDAPLEEQRNAVVAKERAEGARKKEDFYAMANALGYNTWIDETTPVPYIRLVDGEFIGFIVGYSIVGQGVICDGDSHRQNTISCYGTHVSGQTGNDDEKRIALRLQALLNSSHTFGTNFVFMDE